MKTSRAKHHIHLIFLLALLLQSCGGGGGSPPAQPTPVPASVVIASIAQPTAGDFVQLSAVVKDSSGNILTGQAVTWATDNPTVATITAKGMLMALGAGNVNITATVSSKSNTLATSVAANSNVKPGQVLFFFGPEETVFDYATQRCNDGDVPDEPAHPIRLVDGSLLLFAANDPLNHDFSGADFNSLKPNCATVLQSVDNPTAQSFMNRQWISGLYRQNNVIHALIHNEYHDPVSVNCKPGDSGPGNPCWYNSLTYAASTDNGKTFVFPTNFIVAPAPFRWSPPPVKMVNSVGMTGYSNPTNIVSRGDGYYYSMFNSALNPATNFSGGICVMRTQTLGDASSWRAWDGTGFNLAMINPYTTPIAPTACTPVTSGGASNLTYNSYLQQFMLTQGGCGFSYRLSADLITWTPDVKFKAGFLAPFLGNNPCPGPSGDLGVEMYPSIVDHLSTSVNFEDAAQIPSIYYMRYMSSISGAPRNLIRQQLIILKSPVSGTNFTPPRADGGLPVANSVISGTITLIGWAFDNVGIGGIQILLDGTAIGSPTLGFARPDIPIAFPGAPANSGFEFAFDSSPFSNGPHVISTVVTNTSGITTTMQSPITINQALDVITPQGPPTLDTPSVNSTVVGTMIVSGWAFDNVAISKVNILLDGSVIGSATLGLSRPDIKAALIGAPTNSGFQFTFNSASFPNGAHVISYVAYDIAGNTKQGNTQITIAN